MKPFRDIIISIKLSLWRLSFTTSIRTKLVEITVNLHVLQIWARKCKSDTLQVFPMDLAYFVSEYISIFVLRYLKPYRLESFKSLKLPFRFSYFAFRRLIVKPLHYFDFLLARCTNKIRSTLVDTSLTLMYV